ncbi:MAG: L-threonylcarbamoyladenylate synthase [Candidatus Omnitrophota bacterium]
MQTKVIKLDPYFPDERLISEAALVLKNGGIVAFPTETVYGAGVNALDKNAMERLRGIKKRPADKPFTIHIAGLGALDEMNIELSNKAIKIIDKFWPGPLTIVALNRKKEKVGLRMPDNKIALSLIKKAGVPVAAPSANMSGRRPPVSAQEVIDEMSGFIDIILDGGRTERQQESTVVDVTSEPFAILRNGAIPGEDLLADYHVLFVCTGNSCRSVMAKGLLEKFIRESGLSGRVAVDSAGTSTYIGIKAASNTIDVMKEEGVDVSAHSGKPVTFDLLKKSDYVFVMEGLHRNAILNMASGLNSKVRLLKDNEDIPDPIGKSLDEYRRVLGIIKEEVEDIFLEIFKKEK